MNAGAATLIHEARLRADLSQRELARRAGTSQAVISDYENGKRDPGIGHLRDILRAAGFDLDLKLNQLPDKATAEIPEELWLAVDDPTENDRILDNLRLTPSQRLRQMGEFREFVTKHRGSLSRR
jgi:transcriptional regulator with XRE-family HTH domain